MGKEKEGIVESVVFGSLGDGKLGFKQVGEGLMLLGGFVVGRKVLDALPDKKEDIIERVIACCSGVIEW